MEFLDETPEGEVLDAPVKPGTIRIILADSQAIYRVGIRKIFALEDDLRVVAQADSLENLRLALERYPTDVVLLEGGLLAGVPNAIPDVLRVVPMSSSSSRPSATTRTTPSSSIVAAFAASSPAPSRPTCWSAACAESPPAKPGSTTSP